MKKHTEELILDAAKEVFHHKGMSGARMQEIADKAGINKAMLHYYYRNKQQLFEAVFKSAIQLMVPKIIDILTKEVSLFDKIRHFTNIYISFLQKHSFMPLFIINEISRNPNLLKDIFRDKMDEGVKNKLVNQVNELIEKGEIRPIQPEQLLLNVMSLSIFPIIGESLFKTILQQDNKAYKQLIEQHKVYVSEFIINAIKR